LCDIVRISLGAWEYEVEPRKILEREIGRGRNFGAKELAVLSAALDMAWKRIAPDITNTRKLRKQHVLNSRGQYCP
jgi:hypothetical protein